MAKKHLFIQDTGIFHDEFVVACGISDEELKKYAKKEKFNKGFHKVVFDECEYTIENDPRNAHTYYDTVDNTVKLLSFSKYEDSWDFWSSVIHEVVHVVQRLEISKGLRTEDEARAYLTEYLFTNIRRKIQSGKYKLSK